MNTLAQDLKALMISNYRKIGDNKALIVRSFPVKVYTGNELANEVENETEFGINQLGNLLQLTIDLLKRDKVNFTDKIKSTESVKSSWSKEEVKCLMRISIKKGIRLEAGVDDDFEPFEEDKWIEERLI